MMHPEIGLIGRFLNHVGLDWDYTLNGTQAMAVVVLAASWTQVSCNFVFFLAGLQSISRAVIEAARIDGAGPIRFLFDILIPVSAANITALFVILFIYGWVAQGRAAALAAGATLFFDDGPRAAANGTAPTIGIRPEHVVLDPSGMPLAVDLIEPLGSETLLHGRLADGTRLVVKRIGTAPPEEPFAVRLPAAALHIFDAAAGARLEAVAAAREAHFGQTAPA
jgi:Binding-protein-dependent transport system inner membrane component/TOBE domain